MVARKYLIYVACGSAAASANLVRGRLSEILREKGIDAELQTLRVSEVANAVKAQRPDLVIITAGNFSKEALPPDLPVLSGLPLMTMVNVDGFMKQIEEALNKAGE